MSDSHNGKDLDSKKQQKQISRLQMFRYYQQLQYQL